MKKPNHEQVTIRAILSRMIEKPEQYTGQDLVIICKRLYDLNEQGMESCD